MEKKITFLILSLLCMSPAFAEDSSGLRNETEAGIVITGGNTDISTLTFRQGSRYTNGAHSFQLNARYLRSSNSGVEQALQWGFGLRYEHLLSETFALFLGQLVESNVYQNIFQRYATDLGGKYYFVKREKDFTWTGEAGYRYTRENYFSSYKTFSFGRLFTEMENYLGEALSVKLGLEYLPNLTRWKAYQFNGNISLNAAISSIFSFKTGFELRYNNEPPAGAKSTSDRVFTTSLITKF